MAYQVLARKYRPQRFADVAGQDHVTVTLMSALRQDRIAHGYIFSGHRGIGKTTIARILACALNCQNAIGSALRPTPEPCEVCASCMEIRAGSSVDVIEIDAATNRGIDEIRELRDAARYRPSRDRFKIYILDEAHQITDAAFNALLKTLEEPPDHIVFMMATTQPEDIPQTVRSRCQHFSFHAVKLADILAELRGIAEHEGVDADPAALNLLAEAGDGSMRDALSIMDQAIASAPVHEGRARLDAGQIRELMGTVASAVFERIFEAVDRGSAAEVMTVANDLLDAGNSPAQLARQAVRYLRGSLIAKVAGLTAEGAETSELLQVSPEEQRRAARTAARFSEEELTRFLQVMLRTFDELGYRQEPRFHFELGLMKLVHLRRLLPVEEVLSRLGAAAGVQVSSVPAERQPAARSQVQAQSQSQATAPAAPAFSPFERDRQRRYGAPPVPAAVESAQAAPFKQAAEPERVKAEPARPQSALNVRPGAASEIAPAAVEPVQGAAPEPAVPGAHLLAPEPVAAEPLSQPSHRFEDGPEVRQAAPVPEPAANPDTAHTSAHTPEPNRPASEGVSPEAESASAAAVAALQAAGQHSAADAMAEAQWTVADGEANIAAALTRTMLPVVVNAEAEKLLRATLRERGIARMTLTPASAQPAGATPRRRAPAGKSARAGSVQARAAEHPMVQQAQRLFDAEIHSVIDLSDKRGSEG